MRLLFRLPVVESEKFEIPKVCPYAGCKGKDLQPFREVSKPLQDTQYRAVNVWRYRCMRRGRTFWVYPDALRRQVVDLQRASVQTRLENRPAFVLIQRIEHARQTGYR